MEWIPSGILLGLRMGVKEENLVVSMAREAGIKDIYKSIMAIFEHYRENSTDMFPGQIADMIETKTLPKLFELTNNLLTNIVPML